MTATAGSRPTAAYSATLEVELAHQPGTLGRLCTAIGDVGGNIQSLDGFTITQGTLRQHIVVDASSEQHIVQICDAVNGLEGITVIAALDRTFELHAGGKLETVTRIPLRNADDLSMAYTPGVARVCRAIADEPERVHDLTIKGNTVAIVSDGTAVLGLGDIGPAAAMPVMEGKALLFKEFAGVDAFPICLDVNEPDEIVETVIRLAPTFGGINLEDIAAPGAFEVEEALRAALDIPVFHDDQHGTAVVALAALENSARSVGKELAHLRCVILGAGAAGVATAKILLGAGLLAVSSDYPNQINNVLAFPGIFRGAFDAGATDITENMKIAAAEAIAAGVSSDDLSPDLVIPTAFDRSVVPAVAAAVAQAAHQDQVTR